MRLSSEWKKTAAITASFIGLISSLISLFTTSFNSVNLWIGVGIITLTVIVVLVILFVIPKDNMPEGMEVVVDEFENNNHFQTARVIFPCDSRYFSGANKLAKEKFGKNSVSTKVIDDWKKKNELILTCLTDSNKLVGYFDILPLKTAFAQQLIAGDVGEKDIRAEHMLGPHEMKDAEYIYFAGIAVQHTDTGKGYLHGTYLLCAAILYVKLFYSHSKIRKVITIPTSECGLKIAEHLEFIMEREGKLRKDGFDLYSYEFQSADLSDIIKRKKELFRRFNSSAYWTAFKKIYDNTVELPLSINFADNI